MNSEGVSYTVERFLSDCSKPTAKALRKVWADGSQLATAKVPTEALPCVVILAAWAARNDIPLVDDYPALLDRMRGEFGKGVHHPDLFLASCICILDERGQTPSIGSFEAVKVPDIYDQLLGE